MYFAAVRFRAFQVKTYYAELLQWRVVPYTTHLATTGGLFGHIFGTVLGNGQMIGDRDWESIKQMRGFDDEDGSQVIPTKCQFGKCRNMGACHKKADLCGIDDMNTYIDIVYNKKQKLVHHVKKFYVYSLGHVHMDADGTKWLKINQWTGGMYEKNTEAYGTVRTAGPGDGKLADTVINIAMIYNAEGVRGQKHEGN